MAGDARGPARSAARVYALIPALLKVRLGANEILTSLMLVYVADLPARTGWCAGRVRDPFGFNMAPDGDLSRPKATMPLLPRRAGGSTFGHAGIMLLIVALAAVLVARKPSRASEIRLVGEAPRAARFAGFDGQSAWRSRVFMVAGAARGPRRRDGGRGETVRQLQPGFSPGYGFTAIKSSPSWDGSTPSGCLIAGTFVAITFIGGEGTRRSCCAFAAST